MRGESMKEPRKITVGLIFSYIFGGMFIISGLEHLISGNILGGIAILISGIVIFPATYKIINTKTNVSLSAGVKLLIVLIAFIIFASTTNDTNLSENNNVNLVSENKKVEVAKKPELEIISLRMVKDEFGGYVIGEVRNNTNKQYDYAQIDINLYDSQGVQVGSTFANITDLEPKGTWKFKAPFFENEAVKCKVKSLWGY
jgi:hypothetical protein